MDERRRLLERAYSREGASEPAEQHVDPATGETVRMTPSQWALAEYDRRHGAHNDEGTEAGESRAESTDAHHDSATPGVGVEGWSLPEDDRPFGSRPPARRMNKALPFLAAVGGLVLGVAVAIGIEGALGSPLQSVPSASPATTGPASVSSAGSGQGDEGATLAAVANYFASAPRVDNLPPDVTRGFDATSFHEVAGTVTVEESSSIYAAHRLDDTYCLVAVVKDERAAETCGTLDDIARRGLTLSKDAMDGKASIVTVTWQTDGTISWEVLPTAG
ncbi:hypothetical protein [Humibacter sp. RRB41]|uniref:hypothetical protein n=1 Tax=Humibacter sp. RRB41 TaxID=2919946 RepID=UPI001FAAC38D|nr:hypothetical protein [Humibacter sp. RRB41]